MRWVWPTIIASMVVSWSWSAIDRIGPVQGWAAVRPGGVAAGRGALVDDHDLDVDALVLQADGLGVDPRSLVEEREARGGAGRDELGGLLELGADDADLDAVDGEHGRGPVEPRRDLAGRGLDHVRREEREVRPRDVVLEAFDAVVELVVAERRGVEAPRVLDVDRRGVVEQAGVGRAGADVVAGGEDQALALEAANSSSNHVASCAAPPTDAEMPLS